MKVLRTDTKSIEALEAITRCLDAEGKKNIVKMNAKGRQLTEEFMEKYGDCLTNEEFTLSPKLTANLIIKYADRFSLDTLLEKAKGGQILFDVSFFTLYKEELKAIDKDLYKEYLINAVRNAEIDELNETNLSSILSEDDEVDEIILSRIKSNTDLVNRLTLLLISTKGTDVSGTIYSRLDNDTKEYLMGDEVNVRDLLRALYDTNDKTWKNKILDEVVNNEIKVIPSESEQTELLSNFIANSEPEEIIKLFSVKDYLKKSLTTSLIKKTIVFKRFTEDQLLELYDLILKYGCYFELKKIAEDRGFTKILDKMKK